MKVLREHFEKDDLEKNGNNNPSNNKKGTKNLASKELNLIAER